MTIKYKQRNGHIHCIHTNNVAVFDLLALMGCKVVEVKQ